MHQTFFFQKKILHWHYNLQLCGYIFAVQTNLICIFLWLTCQHFLKQSKPGIFKSKRNKHKHKQIIHIFLYYKHLKWNNHPGHTVIALKETSIANLISIIYKNSYQAKYYTKSSCKQKSITFQSWLGFKFYSVILCIRKIMPKIFQFGTYCSSYGQLVSIQ